LTTGYKEERTLIDIGEELGVCRERVRQIEEKAKGRLRRKLARDGVKAMEDIGE
jgi:DNA-directed RNA polymerase sigma subunit (sigma70/sigma32)